MAVNNSANVIAAVILGGAVLYLGVSGKATNAVALLKKDADFLKWIFALGFLFALYKFGAIKGPIGALIATSLIGLFLTKGPTITANAKSLFNSIP